jgi:hypothetical protein
MAYASRAGRAKTSSRNPQAHAICDRCGFRYNHVSLRWQYDFAGAGLINKRILVCTPCYDKPNPQLRAIVIPADPVPIQNPRIQDFVSAESNTRVTSGQNTTDLVTGIPIPGGNTRITQDDDIRVTQQTGEPPGGLNQLPGTDPNVPGSINVPPDNDSVPETGFLQPPYPSLVPAGGLSLEGSPSDFMALEDGSGIITQE